MFRITSELGPYPYRGFAGPFRVVLITKQSRGKTFRVQERFAAIVQKNYKKIPLWPIEQLPDNDSFHAPFKDVAVPIFTYETSVLDRQKVSLRDSPVFFVQLNKHGRLVGLPKFDTMQLVEVIDGLGVIVFDNPEKERDQGLEADVVSSAGRDDGQFDKTRWSMVLGAVQSRTLCAQKALDELCGLYWRPLYAFARRRGHSPEDAQDLVQGFFEHLIGSRGLATVERSKGRFRSFLLASFQNFINAENRRAHAEKRGGRAEVIRLDWQDAETRLGLEPEDRLTPETLYDAQWALLLLRRATARLEQEQAVAGKAKAFRTLKGFLGRDVDSHAPVTYQDAAEALGVGVPNVTSLIHRLRQRHTQLVREEVERTVLDPAEVEAELHGLCDALVQAEGQVRA